MKCPKCGGLNFSTERCIFGNTICLSCGYKDKTTSFQIYKGEPKQIIVIRKDLKMSAGKLAAQVAHASVKAYSHAQHSEACNKWESGSFKKVIVYVKSEDKLKSIYKKAQELHLPCSIIFDEGRTEFGEETLTCVGIGPSFPDAIDKVTKKLRLFDARINYE